MCNAGITTTTQTYNLHSDALTFSKSMQCFDCISLKVIVGKAVTAAIGLQDSKCVSAEQTNGPCYQSTQYLVKQQGYGWLT